jgi:hypothetical protein
MMDGLKYIKQQMRLKKDRADIMDLPLIIPIAEVESGIHYMSGAENLH